MDNSNNLTGVNMNANRGNNVVKETTTDRKVTEVRDKILPYNRGGKSKMRRLTASEKGYVRSIAQGKTRRQAIRDNYNVKPDGSVKTLDKMAELIEKRPAVIALLNRHEEQAQQTVIDVMTYASDYGRTRDRDGATYARVALDGANSLLDRVHGKAKQSIDVQSSSVSISIDMSASTEEE